MFKSTSKLNSRAATLAVSLSIVLCAMAILVFTASAQHLSASEQESVVAHASQSATLSASTVPTGTVTMPNGDLVPRTRLPINFAFGSVGTATLPGTSTLPGATQIRYTPIIHVE